MDAARHGLSTIDSNAPAAPGRPTLIAGVGRSPVDLEVVIPAFNEESRLGPTLHETAEALRSQPWSSRIVVVDNGSTDRTAEVVDQIGNAVPVRVIGCYRQGKGVTFHHQ